MWNDHELRERYGSESIGESPARRKINRYQPKFSGTVAAKQHHPCQAAQYSSHNDEKLH